jgi:hypothetical protein
MRRHDVPPADADEKEPRRLDGSAARVDDRRPDGRAFSADRRARQGLAAGLAAKVGLSGTCAVAALDAGDAKRAQGIGGKVGALIEIHDIDHGRTWPIENDQFDMVVIDDTTGAFSALDAATRQACLRHALGALRRGGRIEVIARLNSDAPGHDPLTELSAAGFKPVRLLAERDRFRFVEGLRAAG